MKAIAARCDALFVIGAPNSSNSRRLVEVAAKAGCANAHLIQHAGEIDWSLLHGVERIGLSAGASAPESLVEAVIEELRARYAVALEEVAVTREDVTFKLPAALRA